MRLRWLVHLLRSALGRCGEACCVGRSQAALRRTLDREPPKP